MGKVFRCFVEKKPGFDVEAGHLLGELKGTLGLSGLTGVRVIRRYDVEGVEQRAYEAARTTILSEPQVDRLWDETMPKTEGALLAVEALPGQRPAGGGGPAGPVRPAGRLLRPVHPDAHRRRAAHRPGCHRLCAGG